MPQSHRLFVVALVGGALAARAEALCAAETSSVERPPRRLSADPPASPLSGATAAPVPAAASPSSRAPFSPASGQSRPSSTATSAWPFDDPPRAASVPAADRSSAARADNHSAAVRRADVGTSTSDPAGHAGPRGDSARSANGAASPSPVVPARAVQTLPAETLSPEATANRSEPVRLSPRGGPETAMTLRPRGQGRSASPANLTSLITVGGSLSIVLGLFFLVAWLLKRPGRKSLGRLPRDVLDVLGRSELPGGREQLQLVRLGRKLVLLWVSSSGVESLAEVTDPAEVDYLVGLCQQTRAESSTNAFHEILQQVGRGEAPEAATMAPAAEATLLGKLFRRSGDQHG